MIELNDNNFVKTISESGKTLIEVYAPFCNPCKNMKNNILPKFADSGVTITILDGTTNNEAIQKITEDSGQEIMSVPVLLLYENGKFVARYDGFMNEEKLKNFIG
jgi:thioredoxin-like negative regulator of GroEL